MRLNDKKIKSLIREWRESSHDSKTLSSFRKETELYIYNFPRLAYRKDKDFCGDFYLYVLERLESILNNVPEKLEILFQTWFNYVLRNKLIDFSRTQRHSTLKTLSIEDYQDTVPVNAFHEESEDIGELKEALNALDPLNRLLIKFYFLPENLFPDELQFATEHFKMSYKDILSIQQSLISSHFQQIKNIRAISAKLNELYSQILFIKQQLYQTEIGLSEKNALLARLSRFEGSRFKLVKRLFQPDKKAMSAFVLLFKNVRKARYRLHIAQRRIRFEMIKIKKAKETLENAL